VFQNETLPETFEIFTEGLSPEQSGKHSPAQSFAAVIRDGLMALPRMQGFLEVDF
jgi:hypothetical protein